MIRLKPFWRYYGGKNRAAKHYPKPEHRTVIEPFAGAAGYACHYPLIDVVLYDVNPRVAGTWDYLIRTTSAEIRAIPDCRAVDDLPSWVPQEGRWLVGWWLHNAVTEPGKTQSSGRRALEGKTALEYWNRAVVERITGQQPHIRHWKIHNTGYESIPNNVATWFIDPPYEGKAGKRYTFSDIDYVALGSWCKERSGQVIVCEADGATWMPFQPLAFIKAMNGRTSAEVVWLK